MKPSLIIILLFFCLNAFSQVPTKPKQNQSTRDINNVKGNQTINNYYYTINNNYNSQLTTKENAINATRGFFKKAKDTTSSLPFLRLGGMTSYGAIHSDINLSSNPVDPIRVYKIKGQIKIDAVLRDSKGDEFARISGDTWEISNTSNIEFNNDATAFEIRSGKRVIFQIETKRDTVFCYGMLCDEGGYCVYASQNGGFYSAGKIEGAPQRFVLPTDLIIKPIFKYPRFQYVGIRDTTAIVN